MSAGGASGARPIILRGEISVLATSRPSSESYSLTTTAGFCLFEAVGACKSLPALPMSPVIVVAATVKASNAALANTHMVFARVKLAGRNVPLTANRDYNCLNRWQQSFNTLFNRGLCGFLSS